MVDRTSVRMRTLVVLACGLVGLASGAQATRGRRVVGTVTTTGVAESALEPGAWRPLDAGALLEDTTIRTGATGASLLQLPNGDLLGLAEGSVLHVDAGTPTRLTLESGRLAVRLVPGSPTRIALADGVVGQGSSGGMSDALLVVDPGAARVEGYQGSVSLTREGGAPAAIDAGQLGTLPAAAGEPIVVAKAEAEQRDPEGKGGSAVSLPFGISPLVASLLTGGLLLGVGAGAIGIGSAGGGGGGSSGGGGGGGSPFRATAR